MSRNPDETDGVRVASAPKRRHPRPGDELRRNVASRICRTLGTRCLQRTRRRTRPPVRSSRQTNGKAYAAARREAIEFTNRLADRFDDVDVLAMPTIRTLPPKLGRIGTSGGMDDLLGNTAPFNLSGMPAVTLPVAEAEGLPVSAQVVAPRFEDRRALRAATTIEQHVDV